MRWFIRISAVVLVLLAGYTVWPVAALYKLATAVETRNAAAINDATDWTALRRDLTSQVVATYLRLTGKSSGLGEVGSRFATGIGVTIADPVVADLLTPESLLDLLQLGGGGAVLQRSPDIAPLKASALDSAWRVWLASEYRIGDFFVGLPPERAVTARFRLHLRLVNWTWRLVGIDLPEELRVRLAQEVIKAERAQ